MIVSVGSNSFIQQAIQGFVDDAADRNELPRKGVTRMTVGDLKDALAQYDPDLEVVSIVPDGSNTLAVQDLAIRPVTGIIGDDGLFTESADGKKYLYIG